MDVRLWEHRAKFPKPPLADIAKFFKETSDPSPSHWEKPEPPDGTWDSILPHLKSFKSVKTVFAVMQRLLKLHSEQEREWLEEHREEISDDECGIIEYLPSCVSRWMVIIT